MTYDTDLRLSHATFAHPTSSISITYYDLGVGYDAVGNVTSVSAALPAAGGQSGGQDNQQFCYDEQNRLIWAGDTGTNPCTNQAVSGTTLTAASYTASYSYDVNNRITQSTLTGALASDPQGSYTYDSTHYHAVDAIGSSYTAQYDASGNMTCRAPTGSETCTSTSQTGAQFTYDVEGRLIQWVSADGATTVKYGYDGEGHRFEMQVTSGSTTTTTTYLGNLEEVQVVGSSTTTIVYFYWGGQRVAEDENTHWYYPINDGLTTTTVVVDASGVIATQLFGPYGQTRWAGGTMPTSYGFTGQRSDVTTGLDYYGARYYDPLSGCFTSADTVLPGGGFDPAGLNRYGYVSDNPETLTDPTGHDQWWKDLPPSGGGGNACPIGVETCGSGGGHSSPGGALWSKSCGSLGEASCSPGGSNVNACLGKSHCVILINGGPNSIDAPSGGENGFESDINGSWQQWIDSIYALYGGDVGFIVMETSGSDSSNGADLIHTTLASLGAQLYNGSISLIGASAGAGAVFQYLDKAGTGLYYSGDPIISSFVALDAPVKNVTSETLHFPWCLADACIGEFAGVGLQEMGQNLVTHWGGDLYYVEKYVQDHHVRGLYEWTSNDPISSEVNGGGLWKTREYSAQPGNAHEYIESQYPDSDVLNTLCPTCP